MQLTRNQIVARYKERYSVPNDIEITEEMVFKHWELENKLTQDILQSTASNRWEVSENSYTTLFSDINWLNKLPIGDDRPPEVKYEVWLKIIGTPPKKVYEVGSGKATLITYLAQCGIECKATEITRERGAKHVDASLDNLTWGNSDGINLAQFEPSDYYDFVISNQVVEHLHPDDIDIHFQNAYKILNQHGSYVFTTPHCHTGPHDLSWVFGCDQAQCMHLKEYTYSELKKSLEFAGFKNISCAVPANISKIFSKLGFGYEKQTSILGSLYLSLLLVVESLIFAIPSKKIRCSVSKLFRKLYLFADNIFLIARK